MRELEMRGLRDAVLEASRSKPFLGICIGLQMLFEHSAEGDVAGLGILRASVVRFATVCATRRANRLKVPHMAGTRYTESNSPYPAKGATIAPALRRGLGKGARSNTAVAASRRMPFYFVHSYYVQPQDAHWCRRPATIRSRSCVRWAGQFIRGAIHRKKAKRRAEAAAKLVQWNLNF